MLDIKMLMENKENVERLLLKRMDNVNLNEIIDLEKERIKLTQSLDQHRTRKNMLSSEISRLLK